jgi:hypothetical protein
MRSQLPFLGKVASILTSRFRTPAGSYVMGQLLPPSNSSQAGMADPRRPFRTSHKSLLKPGDVIIGAENRRYLILDNGISDRDGVEYKIFKVLPLNRSDVLKRTQKTFDNVTKRTVETLVTLNIIWYELEPMRPMEDTFRIPTDQYTLITYYPVKPGDRLGEIEINRVEFRLGVYQFQGHRYGTA